MGARGDIQREDFHNHADRRQLKCWEIWAPWDLELGVWDFRASARQLSALQAAFEVLDRLRDSFVELDLRFPTENFPRPGDIGLAHFRIVHGKRFVFDLRFRSRDPNDLFRELFDRHLARVPDVHWLVEIAHGQPENSVDQVRHITERARLRAVAENGERRPAQRLADECRHHPPVAQSHPRPVSVEDAHDLRVDPVITVVRHRHRLGEPLRFIVNAAGPDRVHVPPVIFRLRMNQRIAIALGGGSEHERRLLRFREAERVMGAERADFQRRDRQLQVIDRAGRRGKMENVIDRLLDQDVARDVVLDVPVILVPAQVRDVRRVPRDEIIDRDDPVPLRQEPVRQMRPEKPRPTRND